MVVSFFAITAIYKKKTVKKMVPLQEMFEESSFDHLGEKTHTDINMTKFEEQKQAGHISVEV